MVPRQRFRKHEHLRLRTDFDRVFRVKSTAADDLLVVHVARNNLGWSRLGISVAKRLGNAVRRNYTRRRIREAFRIGKADLPIGYDIVCIARPRATVRDGDVAASLCTLITQAVRRWVRDTKATAPRNR